LQKPEKQCFRTLWREIQGSFFALKTVFPKGALQNFILQRALVSSKKPFSIASGPVRFPPSSGYRRPDPAASAAKPRGRFPERVPLAGHGSAAVPAACPVMVQLGIPRVMCQASSSQEMQRPAASKLTVLAANSAR
jgi:hypothetical protein